jgi:hypothetical protein
MQEHRRCEGLKGMRFCAVSTLCIIEPLESTTWVIVAASQVGRRVIDGE